MTMEYCIREIRRHEAEISDLIEDFGNGYRDYERSKEYYPDTVKPYLETWFKSLAKLSDNLRDDAEKLKKWDTYIKES